MQTLPDGIDWPTVMQRAHESRHRQPKNAKELYFSTALMVLLGHLGYEIREPHGPPRPPDRAPWLELNRRLLQAAAELESEASGDPLQ